MNVGNPKTLAPEWRAQHVAERRIAVEQVLWSLPGLIIAAQAFLFAIGLDPGTSWVGRIVIAFVGVATCLATAAVMWEQAARLELLRDWLQENVQSVTSEFLRTELPAQKRDRPALVKLVLAKLGDVKPARVVSGAWVIVLAVFLVGDVIVGAAGVAELGWNGDFLSEGD